MTWILVVIFIKGVSVTEFHDSRGCLAAATYLKKQQPNYSFIVKVECVGESKP